MKKSKGNVLIFIPLFVLLLGIVGYFLYQKGLFSLPLKLEKTSPQNSLPTKTFKVLHIMSYHTPWEWTENQLSGFKKGLEGLNVEYKVFEMDTKRNSAEEWKLQKAKEAKELIESWKPELVYTTDDNAQKYIVKDYVNSPIPFVFGAVNSDPSVYGFKGSSNITGVLEHEHSVETVNLLKQIVPGVTKIAIIYDDDPTWTGVTARMKQRFEKELPEVEIVSWDNVSTFEEYKKKVLDYQTKVDALGLLGVHTFKDKSGKNVTWQDVLKWTAENSNLPDFSFWEDRVGYGTLAAVAVSGYEQGLAAGKLARQILVDGRSPSTLAMQPTLKGKPLISLARANKLEIKINSSLLSSMTVVDKFAW